MKIKFTHEAQFDFRESVKFYEIRQKGLGKKFSEAVKNTLYFIGENPLGSEVKYLEVRVTTVKKFPFTIHYSIENGVIIIFAVFHNSRSPRQKDIT